jgi:hypothetical protein
MTSSQMIGTQGSGSLWRTGRSRDSRAFSLSVIGGEMPVLADDDKRLSAPVPNFVVGVARLREGPGLAGRFCID